MPKFMDSRGRRIFLGDTLYSTKTPALKIRCCALSPVAEFEFLETGKTFKLNQESLSASCWVIKKEKNEVMT